MSEAFGDEPFIEARRRTREAAREAWLEDHWDELGPGESPDPEPGGLTIS
ncbi:MAG TPA: hypothetical protein VLH56_19040 [Dissulfurispiraceae bacterium]|nr:hypothetical protein [Dissulfurispiraceae bacterium]